MKTKYSKYDIERFYRLLAAYEQALKTGTKNDIIITFLAVYAAKGNVSPRLRSLVNQTFKNTVRETPLTD